VIHARGLRQAALAIAAVLVLAAPAAADETEETSARFFTRSQGEEAPLGFDSDVKAADGEPGIAAPFLGLAFDF
jgi:hypothetical protein